MAFKVVIGNVNHMRTLPAQDWSDIDALLTKIAQDPDATKRSALAVEVQERFWSEWLFWYPVQHVADYNITASNLQGFQKVAFSSNFNRCWFD